MGDQHDPRSTVRIDKVKIPGSRRTRYKWMVSTEAMHTTFSTMQDAATQIALLQQQLLDQRAAKAAVEQEEKR